MERLTERNHDTTHENGICCTNFLSAECHSVEGDCSAGCKWEEAAWERLAAYEDTGLTPEEINDLASVREISPEAEYAINKHADNIIARLDKLLHQTDDDARLRELTEADKDGRVVVLPCRVGQRVFALLDTDKHISECEVKQIGLGNEIGFACIEPIGARGREYGVLLKGFSKTVFLTREDAERALEARNE